jgi:Tol biopolymer transport system component/DNA-binding winged helix-turn-helix (wHTH) protein
MGSNTRNPRVVHFAGCTLDLETAELRRNGTKTSLQDQPFQILITLLENSGRLVTREELTKVLWPTGTFVDFNQSLNKAVARLREALGDDAEQPRFIETLPRRGYRLLTPPDDVEEEDQLKTPVATLAPPLAPVNDSSSRISPGLLFPILVLAGVLTIVAGLVGWIVRRQTEPSVRGPERALTRLTFEPGLQIGVAWSPDSRFIAYSSNQGGKFDIWIRQVSGGDPIQITHSPAANWQPEWSPDGKYIVYRSEEDKGGLYVIPALGGASRKIADFGYDPRWSPGGKQILFLPTTFGSSRSLYTVSLDGGSPQTILGEFFAQHRDLRLWSAAWHPDGQRITLYIWNDQTASPVFWTIPVAGGEAIRSEIDPSLLTKLVDTTSVTFAAAAKFSWDPFGRAIYFERTIGGAANLWKLKVDPKTLRGIGIERLTTGPGSESEVAISSDGKKLAFSAESRKTRIWVAPFDFLSGKLTGKPEPMTSESIEAWLPSLSSDGQKLAFSGRRAGLSQIWQKSLPSGVESPIEAGDSYGRGGPIWSPDGQQLVYTRWKLSGSQSSIVTWSHSSGEKLVIEGEDYEIYGWAADGQKLVVSKWDPETHKPEIWLLPLAAELPAEKIAASPNYYLFQGQCSPDGRWITFEAVRDVASGRESAIYIVPARGGSWIQVTNSQQWDDKPRWSPDGKMIYFISGQGGLYNVWGARFDPVHGRIFGPPFRVTNLNDPSLMVPTQLPEVGLSVARKRLALAASQSTGSIWILDKVDE